MQKSNKRICYGFYKNHNDEWCLGKDALNVAKIYIHYSNGKSIRDIIKILREEGVSSPSGKPEWSPRAIEKILSNESYKGKLIPIKLYNQVQAERELRSNKQVTESGTVRKNTRYNSKNPFSGHLVCSECGGVYRRITKHDGSVVWRCVNRVEKGDVICEQSPTIPEEQLILAMVNILGEKYRDCEIHNKIGEILVCKDGSLEVAHDAKLNLTM